MVQIKTKVDVAQLETEFKTLIDSVGVEIDEKLQQAKKLVYDAIALSIKHGVPFYSPVSILGDSFVPPSFREKFWDLDKNDVAELTGIPFEELKNERYSSGWDHSSVCF